MVNFPNVVCGKVWKLARPYYGPYVIESLTPTNAEVQLVNHHSENTILVALDRVRVRDRLVMCVWDMELKSQSS